MESISGALRIMAEQVEMLDNNNERILTVLHDRYIRPLQESKVMKKVEVAKRLDVSPTTVAQMILLGDIPTTKDGKVTEWHLWKYLTRDGEIH